MRGLSRTGMILVALLAGLLLSYAVLLNTRAAGAQDEETPSSMIEESTDEMLGESTGGEEGLCAPDEELVDSVSGRDDQTTEAFNITGPDFRVVVRATSASPTSGDVTVNVLDEDGLVAGGAFVFVDPDFQPTDTASSSVIDGPGTFRLEIDTNGASYEIAVCQTPGQGGGTTEADEDTDDDGVIDDTIPKKPLPDTGGSTALMVGGSALLLLYGVLVAWRLKTRER